MVPTVIGVITFGASTAFAFYIKDALQRRSDFRKLKRKLDRIAGKRAVVLYPSPTLGYRLFKIEEIDKHGVTLKNDLETIFIPPAKLLRSEIVLPCDNYGRVKLAHIKNEAVTTMNVLAPAMFDSFKRYLTADDSEFDAIFAIKFRRFMKNEGFPISKTRRRSR